MVGPWLMKFYSTPLSILGYRREAGLRYSSAFRHLKFFYIRKFLQPDIFLHPEILPPRHCATAYQSRHFDTQTFFNRDILPLQSFWNPDILQLKLYPTPPSILTLVTLVQRTQAWPSANLAHMLAFGETKSYSVKPCLPLAATISPAGQLIVFFYWVRPTCLRVGYIIQLQVVLQLLYVLPPSPQ